MEVVSLKVELIMDRMLVSLPIIMAVTVVEAIWSWCRFIWESEERMFRWPC